MLIRFNSYIYIRQLLSAVMVGALCSCGGGSNDSSTPLSDFSGTWNVHYNVIDDECQIVVPNVPGFFDVLEISQQNTAVVVSSRSGFFDAAAGQLAEDGGFNVAQTSEADIFGDGTLCVLENQLSFTAASEEDAAQGTVPTLLRMTISCEDGYGCLSRAVGSAERQLVP